MPNFDVLIIGAGAAGLAAAAECAAAGRSVCILEARDRIGGRIHTRREVGLALPLELGAEFIHGDSPATFDWLRNADIVAIDAAQQRWRLDRGRLRLADDVYGEMMRGLDAVPRPRKDLPLADFLGGPARAKLSRRARDFARLLAEGFDAADATRVSTLQILDTWRGESSADARTFRPLDGYAMLLDDLSRRLDPGRVHIRFEAPVQCIEWAPRQVVAEATQSGRPLRIEATQAICTLPVGVLQLPPQAPGAVAFSPPLPAKVRALEGLGMGPVIKLLLRFRNPFWETIEGGRYRDAAFFHAPNAAFRTFWTQLPLRSAFLVAWAAGPSAVRLSALSPDARIGAALDSLALLFRPKFDLAAILQAVYTHDWQTDPFACGAYSHVLAGGGTARRRLAAPVRNTLWFAGEACHEEAAATATGALESGRHAARQLLAASEPPRRRVRSRGR